MSESNLDHVMLRIRHATPESPIAVFRTDNPEKLNAVFAATVHTQQRIAGQDPSLIGVYHGKMDLQEIAAEIKQSKLRVSA